MKKLYLVCLMMLAGSAWAEWTLFFTGSETGTRDYIDYQTIKKNGNLRQFWHIKENESKDFSRYGQSTRIKSTIDCSKEMIQYLYISFHKELMGGGQIIAQFDYSNDNVWQSIPPQTVSAALFNIVCAK